MLLVESPEKQSEKLQYLAKYIQNLLNNRVYYEISRNYAVLVDVIAKSADYTLAKDSYFEEIPQIDPSLKSIKM